MKPVRCAIYTRKSSDEGLDQNFNSLDAQREACAAYIKSQASEGWAALPDLYDDGGISGGTLERPALQRLLADVAAGKVDVIVVYKVDRLSRSLFDFAKLVELLEKGNTSFVSITQPINNTTSMGRLTLNMLLSFAQFEREVTAERIRDKIAASKAKGMWMGGVPPLGYRGHGRSLAIVEEHATLVRMIFRMYLEVGNVWRLTQMLNAEGVIVPARQLATGKPIGGVPFATGQIHKILRCGAYVGEIHHQGKVHAALHPPIIERELWDQVQAQLSTNTQGCRRGKRLFGGNLFAGKIVDEAGEPLLVSHTAKASPDGGTVRYSYYVSAKLQKRRSPDGWRIPAREIENVIAKELADVFADPLTLIERWKLEVPPDAFDRIVGRIGILAVQLRARDGDLIRSLIAAVRVSSGSIESECDRIALAEALNIAVCLEGAPLILSAAVRLTRTGMAMRLIQGGEGAVAGEDKSLVRLILQARAWWAELRGGVVNVSELAASKGLSASYVTRVLRLAFLSPTVVDAALRGQLRADLDLRALKLEGMPASWLEQGRMLLPLPAPVPP